MKKITFSLLLFVATFGTYAQNPTVQNEDPSKQQIFKEEARELIKTAAYSLIEPHLEKSLKQAFINGPATCFAPDTDTEVVEAFYNNKSTLQNSLGIPEEGQNSRFNLGGRWTSTATSGGSLQQGDFTVLTWSYVPDGTPIGNGGCQVPDIGGNSNFIAFFNGIYGPPTTTGDFTTAPWHDVFVDMFNSWSNVSGLNFVYEPNDDGSTVALSSNSGILGVRGDMRISGHPIDGNSNVLACNYFPNNGDMIIDTADSFYSNNPGLGTINVLTHEIGHGLGIAHVCPINQTKLMEPFISFAFQGPQEDDILASNRHYGDPDGGNDSPATATLLGNNAPPTSYSKVQRSIDDNGDIDHFSFILDGPATLSAELTPTGTTYLDGEQNPNTGACSSGTPFNALTVADLRLDVLGIDGVTVLASSASNGPGVAENVTDVTLPTAGIYYVRIRQQGASINNSQMYDLDLDLTGAGTDVPPTAVCTSFTAQLDTAGNATIVPENVDGGSIDPEGPVTLSVDTSSFTCADIGTNTVTLTVTDSMGQTDTCTATVTVEDNILPTAVCQDFTAQLDASGNAVITAADIDNGSNDNCGIASLAVSQNTFTCADVGATTVTLTVTDVAGNIATCTSTVTVEDPVLPIANCQDFTVELDASGNASITAADIDNGSNDNCGIASLSVAPNTFNSTNVGENTVILTLTDVNGNVATCTAIVTVQENGAPVALCQDITIQLDAAGNATITPVDIDDGSTGDSITLSASQTSFDCTNIGENSVTLTATDANGNSATCTSTVTVEETTLPNANCLDITVQLDASCTTTITAADIDNSSNDNCGIASLALSQSTFTCDDLGSNTVTLIVTDVNGNVSSCTATVTVERILGVDDVATGLSTVGIFPNPADDFISISNPQSIALETVIIYDVTGRLVATHALRNTADEATINISTLQSANYIVIIKGKEGQIIKRLIKE